MTVSLLYANIRSKSNRDILHHIIRRSFAERYSYQSLEDFFNSQSQKTILFIKYNGRLVGSITVESQSAISNFGILPEYQGIGIGTTVTSNLKKLYPKLSQIQVPSGKFKGPHNVPIKTDNGPEEEEGEEGDQSQT